MVDRSLGKSEVGVSCLLLKINEIWNVGGFIAGRVKMD